MTDYSVLCAIKSKYLGFSTRPISSDNRRSGVCHFHLDCLGGSATVHKRHLRHMVTNSAFVIAYTRFNYFPWMNSHTHCGSYTWRKTVLCSLPGIWWELVTGFASFLHLILFVVIFILVCLCVLMVFRIMDILANSPALATNRCRVDTIIIIREEEKKLKKNWDIWGVSLICMCDFSVYWWLVLLISQKKSAFVTSPAVPRLSQSCHNQLRYISLTRLCFVFRVSSKLQTSQLTTETKELSSSSSSFFLFFPFFSFFLGTVTRATSESRHPLVESLFCLVGDTAGE